MIAALLIGKDKSTDFPGKNVFPILGRPLMVYPLLAAKRSHSVDRIYVSTDSASIKAIAREHGAEVIDRPAHLCTKDALSEDVFVHAHDWIRSRLPGTAEIEFIVLLMCNAPMILPETIDAGVAVLRADPTLDSAVTVSCYNMYSPLRARRVAEDGLLRPFVPFEAFGDPNTLNSNRDSQGDVWFADMGVSIIRPRTLSDIMAGLLPQRWMGQRIHPLKQQGGVDVDFHWQVPHVEHWLKEHGLDRDSR
jgi:hypothetical protein